MCHEGSRVGQEPPGWDGRNQEQMGATRMGHEELGWDRRQDRRSQEGTEVTGWDTTWDMGHWDGI